MDSVEATKIVHHFEWGAGTYKVEIHLPRELRQVSTIEQALEEDYVPCQTRAWPIGISRWEPFGVNPVRNTCKGFRASLHLEDLDMPESAEAYVPSGIAWESRDVSKQMIIDFLYFKKPTDP